MSAQWAVPTNPEWAINSGWYFKLLAFMLLWIVFWVELTFAPTEGVSHAPTRDRGDPPGQLVTAAPHLVRGPSLADRN